MLIVEIEACDIPKRQSHLIERERALLPLELSHHLLRRCLLLALIQCLVQVVFNRVFPYLQVIAL